MGGRVDSLTVCFFLSKGQPTADSAVRCVLVCVGVGGRWSGVWCLSVLDLFVVCSSSVLRPSSFVRSFAILHSSLVTRHSFVRHSPFVIRHPSLAIRLLLLVVAVLVGCSLTHLLLTRTLAYSTAYVLTYLVFLAIAALVCVCSFFIVVLAVFVFACSFVCGLSSAL